MPYDQHHDEDPLQDSAARTLQLAAMGASVTEGLTRLRGQHLAEQQLQDERAAVTARAERLTSHASARLQWAPATDPEWLHRAGTPDVGRAWHAATTWAATDPEAAHAQQSCEERLRRLQPEGMRVYDAARTDGATAAAAMPRAVPLFEQQRSARAHHSDDPSRSAVTNASAAPTRAGQGGARLAAEAYPRGLRSVRRPPRPSPAPPGRSQATPGQGARPPASTPRPTGR